MAVPQMIVVSLRGSGTPLLADVTTALGYTSYGTMGGDPRGGDDRPGPGEVYPLLEAAFGQDRATLLLHGQRQNREALEAAFQDAVSALWRIWWMRLGQPTTLASPVDPGTEARLARLPDSTLLALLPGRGCWYLTGLDLRRADAGFLRAWHAGRQPPLVFHHRDIRDRIISQIRMLSRPADRVGSMPEHLIYRDILAALPTLDDRITLALTDPCFPGMEEARRSRWMLHHPAVCVLTHEELTGPTTGARAQALTRLLRALGHPDPSAELAGTPSLATADDAEVAVGTGRTLFTPAHEDLLHRHHSDLLPAGPPPTGVLPDGHNAPALTG
ncbi:hypothetical protein [Streptomyces sp. NBC_01237]|uniref:hypothetical protein n=1 Tax=Streptomyces sp. NBC_01237 TaxID=2903790 RepID=UPI002DD806B6|nr:hypothetical protein [Streptomyces sp. NBC_01237]WRZ70639.1 hypothetical protein OG251_02900 [Streptomyces sp. NBC_01237]